MGFKRYDREGYEKRNDNNFSKRPVNGVQGWLAAVLHAANVKDEERYGAEQGRRK